MADTTKVPDTQPDPANTQGASSTDPDTEMNGTALMNGDKTEDAAATDATVLAERQELENALQEARIPTKKDATLREFLSKMDEHAPIIPDAVTNYYLTLAGLPPPPATPLPLARLLALATQKFIADVAADAYQYSRIRASNTASSNPLANMPGMPQLPGAAIGGKEGAADKSDKSKGANLGVQRAGFGGGGQGASGNKTVLTMEDLGMAVGEYGINVRRGEFYR